MDGKSVAKQKAVYNSESSLVRDVKEDKIEYIAHFRLPFLISFVTDGSSISL